MTYWPRTVSWQAVSSLLAVLVLTVHYPIVAQDAQASRPPAPPGRLVDIGGRRLHLLCSGKGEPTVVLEAGLGAYSVDWGLVQPQVGGFTRVCSYDRASYAWSERGPEPRGLRTSVSELHRLLEAAQVKPPYVMVGQSWGGRIVRLFAHTYPQEVVGMVLIDTFSEGSAEVRPELLANLDLREEEEKDARANLPVTLRSAASWAKAQRRQPDISDVNEDPAELIRSTTTASPAPLGDRPLVVVSAGRLWYGANDRAAGPSLQEKLGAHIRNEAFLATLSRNSQFIVARRSFHEVHLYEPDVITEAIRGVVTAARTGRRLSER